MIDAQFLVYSLSIFIALGLIVGHFSRKLSFPSIIVFGYAVACIYSSFAFQLDLTCRESSEILLTIILIFLMLTKTEAFQDLWGDVKKHHYFSALIVVLLMLFSLGSEEAKAFQGFIFDRFYYVAGSIGFLDARKSTLVNNLSELRAFGNITPVIKDHIRTIAVGEVYRKPAAELLYSVLAAPFSENIYRLGNSFENLGRIVIFAAIYHGALAVRISRRTAALGAFVATIGFWGQFVKDYNSWGMITTLGILLYILFLAAKIYKLRSKVSYLIIIPLTACLTAYPEAVLFVLLFAIVGWAVWASPAVLRKFIDQFSIRRVLQRPFGGGQTFPSTQKIIGGSNHRIKHSIVYFCQAPRAVCVSSLISVALAFTLFPDILSWLKVQFGVADRGLMVAANGIGNILPPFNGSLSEKAAAFQMLSTPFSSFTSWLNVAHQFFIGYGGLHLANIYEPFSSLVLFVLYFLGIAVLSWKARIKNDRNIQLLLVFSFVALCLPFLLLIQGKFFGFARAACYGGFVFSILIFIAGLKYHRSHFVKMGVLLPYIFLNIVFSVYANHAFLTNKYENMTADYLTNRNLLNFYDQDGRVRQKHSFDFAPVANIVRSCNLVSIELSDKFQMTYAIAMLSSKKVNYFLNYPAMTAMYAGDFYPYNPVGTTSGLADCRLVDFNNNGRVIVDLIFNIGNLSVRRGAL